MPNVKNQETLVKIKEDLDGVSAMWVVDYCGLTVKDIQALRTAIRESGASLKVYKNTLMHIALEESNLPTLDDMLAGPSAFVFAGNDVAAAAKAVKSCWPRSPAPFPVSPAASLLPSTAFPAVSLRSRRPWPTRRKLLKRSAGSVMNAA